MIRITVQRGDGLLVAQDVIEVLAPDESVLLPLGRNLMDAAAEKKDETLEVTYNRDYLPGHLIQVDDLDLGTLWRGKITSVEHQLRKTLLGTILGVERFL